VNTTASSVPLKHEPRGEGAAAAKRRELGPHSSARLSAAGGSGGAGPPAPTAAALCYWGGQNPPLAAGIGWLFRYVALAARAASVRGRSWGVTVCVKLKIREATLAYTMSFKIFISW